MKSNWALLYSKFKKIEKELNSAAQVARAMGETNVAEEVVELRGTVGDWKRQARQQARAAVASARSVH